MFNSELLSERYELSAVQQENYQRDGHILLRGVLDQQEIPHYRNLIRETALQHSQEKRSLQERETYGKAFLQIGNLWTKHDEIKRFVLARRFARLAAELMGVPAVRLHFDQALFKEPGGGHTPWHQDQVYWPLDTPNTITMWMPLVDTTANMGTMSFVSGSHREGHLNNLVISDESEDYYDRYVIDNRLSVANSGDMRAGDATFHAGWTLHRAPGNLTDRMRDVMTVVYFADGVRLAKVDSEMRKAAMQVYFPGLNEGDEAKSEQTPIVYDSSD